MLTDSQYLGPEYFQVRNRELYKNFSFL